MNNIKENAVLEALTLTRISDETRNDSALQRFNEAIKNEKQMSRGPLENIVIDNLIRRQMLFVNVGVFTSRTICYYRCIGKQVTSF